ncbi:MAG: NAD(P)H-hydrate dehydratase [Chitinophagaceae bacterium]|nr:NAD(P)H-hydrate dehydratase [Chitinophagaceae bacterium]
MKIFNTEQIRKWDEYTITHEPIASIDLMERAAKACFDWLIDHKYKNRSFSIFCSKGNNGGDGLALARMLSYTGHNVAVFILEFGYMGTNDFQANLARLHETEANISFISSKENIRGIRENDVVIDAVLGSGLNRPLDGLTAEVVEHINQSGNEIIAIDIPTGLFVDKSAGAGVVIHATHTLSFQCYKLAFLIKENQQFVGELHVLNIGLHEEFLNNTSSNYTLVDGTLAHQLLKPRKKFSHKGDYGHGALIVGSTGLMGAAVLCAKAFMRSGAGKLTCHIPAEGNVIMQISVPEAMSKIEKGNDHIASVSSLEKYDAVGIGPGINLYDSHSKLLASVFKEYRKPMVIDADALNVLSKSPELLKQVPSFSILTPHTREFERLFGSQASDFNRIEIALEKAKGLNVIMVLKGPYTFIATPGGMGYFNNSGNPGMATGGTGDVLTGLITGLLCQGYPPEHAAILGVYVHGLAGDLAAFSLSQQAMTAGDVIDYLGEAFKALQ